MSSGKQPRHFTWMIYFLKLDNLEEVNAMNVGGTDEETN
jgi:hypothetical protein